MQKILQKLKEFAKTEPLLLICLVILFFLPIYSGEIIANTQAFLLGKYINYLHVRISLHLLLNSTLLFFYFKDEHKKQLLAHILFYSVATIIAFFSIRTLTDAIGVSFWPLYLSSCFHLAEFFISAMALFVLVQTLVISMKKYGGEIAFTIFVSALVQLIFGIGQLIAKGPIFPNLLSWTGQPAVFTSESYIGIFQYFRIYGTTPHPNILGGILVFFLFWLLVLPQVNRTLRTASLVSIGLLLIATLSKSALLCAAVVVLIYLSRKTFAKISLPKFVYATILLLGNIAIFIFLFFAFRLQLTETFISSRATVQQLYLELVQLNPLLLITGTGFTMAIPTLLANAANLQTSLIWGNQILGEPPHNALLLLFIEVGIPLTTVLLLYVYKTFKMFDKMETWQKFALIAMLLILGGIDHYLVY